MRKAFALAGILSGLPLTGVLGGLAAPVTPTALPTNLLTATQRFGGEECESGSTGVFDRAEFAGVVTGDQLVDFTPVQEKFTGRGVRIAVVDSGVAHTNPGLKGAKITAGTDLSGEKKPLADVVGHGTAVASLIAGQPGEPAPLPGVAPGAEIISVRIIGDPEKDNREAREKDLTPADIEARNANRLVKGIEWAVKEKVDVISVSISLASSSPALEKALADAEKAGIVVVAAAGNTPAQTGPEWDPMEDRPRYPAAVDSVLSVTSVEASGLPTDAVLHSETVDIAAPGANVVVANGSSGTCVTALGGPATSYATAYTAGLVALLLEAHPDESPAQIRHRIMATGVRPNPAKHDFKVGWGLIDPAGALNFVDDGAAPGPDSPVTERPSDEPTAGRDVRPAPFDAEAQTRQTGSLWTGVGVFSAFVLLIAAAGIGRMAQDKKDSSQAVAREESED